MNITFVDADPILWKGDANIRLVDLAKVVAKIHKAEKQDAIYLVGGFDDKNLFKEYLLDMLNALTDLPVSPVSTYSMLEERNVPNIGVMNLFYQSFIAQNSVTDNTYTIVAGDTNFFNMAKFVKKLGANEIRFVLTNDIPQLSTLADTYNIIDTIDVNPNKLSIYDKITIKEILNIIRSSQDKGRFETISNLLYKCEKFSNISRPKTLFITHALIHGDYLRREVKALDDGSAKTTIVLGDKSKLEYIYNKL